MNGSIAIGQVLDDRFEITGLIAEGGMSSIYEALDRSTGRKVALKLPLLRNEIDPSYFARFRREEEIGKMLDHPALVHTLPVEKKSRPYIVLERLHGRLLSDIMKGGHPLHVAQALGIISKIARAMEHMHGRKIIHRDLKPGNVMMCEDGSIRVLDFGLAESVGIGPRGALGLAPPLGTPDYMPPEQVRGQPGDERSDIYSLGAILYEMVTGQAPFQSDDLFVLMNARVVGDPIAPCRLLQELSPQVEEIILRALARDPDSRYASMADFRRDLETPDQVIPTGRAGRLQAPTAWRIKWRRIQDFVWTILLFLGFTGVMILLAAIWGRHRFPGR
jgi:serine/threonine protein kinase